MGMETPALIVIFYQSHHARSMITVNGYLKQYHAQVFLPLNAMQRVDAVGSLEVETDTVEEGQATAQVEQVKLMVHALKSPAKISIRMNAR